MNHAEPSEQPQVVSPPVAAPKFYFPELDGLRFLAFMLVFVHHAPNLDLPGWSVIHDYGWVGVDLFFALSAFLFVKLLAREHERTGTISIRKFFVRRCLRIWPLYFLFCLLMLILTSVSHRGPFFSWRALGLFTFTDNIFSACDGYNPVAYSAHLWTISYEEQFYVFIPFLLLFLFRAPRSKIVLTLSGIALAFTLIRVILIWLKAPHPAIWVLPVSHFESILLGIVVGFKGFDVLFARVPAGLVLALGLVCGWFVTRLGPVDIIQWRLMLSYVLIGLSTSLALYFVFRTGKARWMAWLARGPCVFLGKISYGLYVYHLLGLAVGWKLLHQFGPWRTHDPAPAIIFVAALGITVAMASASYFMLERPFLKIKERYEIVASRPA